MDKDGIPFLGEIFTFTVKYFLHPNRHLELGILLRIEKCNYM